MTRNQGAKPPLQQAMLLTLAGSLLCATLLAGFIASWWLGRYDHDNALHKHQLQLALAGEGLAGELRLLSQAVAQLALDGDVLFAPSAALFASPAIDKMERLLAGHAPGIRGYLTDAKGQLIDAVAVELEPQLPVAVAQLIPQLLQQKSAPTSSTALALQLNQRPALALVQPLILRALADAPVNPGVGALVLLLDSDWLLARSRAQLGDYQLLALAVADQRLVLRDDLASDDLQLSHTLMLAEDFPLTLTVALRSNQLAQQLGSARLQLWLLLLLGVLLLAPLMLWLGMRPARDLQQFVAFCASYRDGDFSLSRPQLRWQEQQQLWAVFQQLLQQADADGGLYAKERGGQSSLLVKAPTPPPQVAAAVADNADKAH